MGQPNLGDDEKAKENRGRPSGPVRRFLRLIIEVDESRHWAARAWAALVLLGLLAAAALLGYAIPELIYRIGIASGT